MTDHCLRVSRMSTILKSFWQVQFPSLLESPNNLVNVGCVQAIWCLLQGFLQNFNRFGPSSLIPLTQKEEHLNKKGGAAHPEGAQKAGCGPSVAEGSFIKRWQTFGCGCWAIWAHYSLEVWRSGHDYWQSALNDEMSLLMRWWLFSRTASRIWLGEMFFCASTWQMCWKPAEQQTCISVPLTIFILPLCHFMSF